jgi:hypothetical protein
MYNSYLADTCPETHKQKNTKAQENMYMFYGSAVYLFIYLIKLNFTNIN